ncbi:uncharacterized protein LOC135205570 [Macrobrachium nipponense]|uniref:uncharacterized protein LOC135205570 n=1 Tax=Macrobrachium nipponense TaxID=159736 RepID=UPI0030C8C628
MSVHRDVDDANHAHISEICGDDAPVGTEAPQKEQEALQKAQSPHTTWDIRYPQNGHGSSPVNISKDSVPSMGNCVTSPAHLAPPSPSSHHTPALGASHSWHHSSFGLQPSLSERSLLLGKSHRSGSTFICSAMPSNILTHDATHRASGFSRKQLLTLASMLLIDLSSFASMSVLAPFFPKQARSLNLSTTFDGVVFSVYAFVIFIVSPVIGKFLPLMNSRKVYLVGIVIAGVFDICFGMTYWLRSPEVFAVITITLRIITALGTAAFLTVIYAVVPVLFPEDMNMVNGMLETAVGIGMCVGPAVGVWLYSIGGFGLPFYGLGGFRLLCAFISYFAYPSHVSLDHRAGIVIVDDCYEESLWVKVVCGFSTWNGKYIDTSDSANIEMVSI